jgi:glycerol kinase
MKTFLAVDSGTTSVRSIVFDKNGNILNTSQKKLSLTYPKPSWVEQDPIEILLKTSETIEEVLEKSKVKPTVMGITNQRETTIIWDKDGNPLYNAIVWQCRRTKNICEKLSSEEEWFRNKTGLTVDPYFSLTKLIWLIEKLDLKNKKYYFGTVESWLAYNFTGKHISDVTNASRTMMMNIKTLKWDKDILEKFKIPIESLPTIVDNVFKPLKTKFGVPLGAMIGDQQSSLFGHRGFSKGDVKITNGTGSFLLSNMGSELKIGEKRGLSTVGWKIGKEITYAFEGSIFTTGSIVEWLISFGILNSASEIDKICFSAKDENIIFLPFFSGLGAPYWNSNIKGSIHGLTRGSSKNGVIKSSIEGIAYRIFNLIEEFNLQPNKVSIDGGLSKSNYFSQLLADLMKTEIIKPKISEMTALGVGFLSGISTNDISMEEIRLMSIPSEKILPSENEKAKEKYAIWKKYLLDKINKIR